MLAARTGGGESLCLFPVGPGEGGCHVHSQGNGAPEFYYELSRYVLRLRQCVHAGVCGDGGATCVRARVSCVLMCHAGCFALAQAPWHSILLPTPSTTSRRKKSTRSSTIGVLSCAAPALSPCTAPPSRLFLSLGALHLESVPLPGTSAHCSDWEGERARAHTHTHTHAHAHARARANKAFLKIRVGGRRDATAGRSLNAADAAKKLEEESQRKVEMAKKQALAGNTHEAQKRLAQHATWTKGGADAPTMMKAGGVNVAKAAQVKTMSHSLYSASKIAVEFEDEDGLKELCLELRELEEAGDFDWMMLGYAEDKKNALRLLETGNGGREAIVDYVREDMAGAQDKVMYLILKEDYSCSKCTFIYWIGSKVPAFVKANTSTHRGAISEWITQVIHNLKEECVSTGNELLGLKDHEEDAENESVVGEGSDAVNESTANVMQIDSQLHAKPYAGKVLEEVVRDKTPHELWLERKMVCCLFVLPVCAVCVCPPSVCVCAHVLPRPRFCACRAWTG